MVKVNVVSPMETFAEEEILIADLTVDRRVQRSGYDLTKIEWIILRFNPGALGVITVSRRKDRSTVIIDGAHRVEAVRRVSENTGKVRCHVFTGLTLAEEAQMFLDLNHTSKPLYIDQFRVRIEAEDPVAVGISKIVHSYGWTISGQAVNGNINAPAALERLWRLSSRLEFEPNLVQLTILVVTRSWGTERAGVHGVILDGIGRLLAEHGSRLNVDNLIERLRLFKGGPSQLHIEATQFAALQKMRVSMAVASLCTAEYNRRMRNNGLPAWGRRA